jgi:hypothetical protein
MEVTVTAYNNVKDCLQLSSTATSQVTQKLPICIQSAFQTNSINKTIVKSLLVNSESISVYQDTSCKIAVTNQTIPYTIKDDKSICVSSMLLPQFSLQISSAESLPIWGFGLLLILLL